MMEAAGKPAVIGERLRETDLCPEDLLKGQEEAFQRDIDRLKTQVGAFVSVSCPACGGSETSPTLEKHTFQYVTCAACGTLFMNPRPSSAIMADYYGNSENYRYWAKHIFPASEEARRDKIHRMWLDRVKGYCERFNVPRGQLVEVGAGFGTFSWLAQSDKEFREVVAIEPTPEMAAACRARGLTVIERRVEEVTDEVTSADVAASFECIEHLFEPRQFLVQCARLLRPGGLLVLSCPNGQGFDVAVLGSASRTIDPEHVNLFNPQSLSRLVESAGFEVLSVTTPGRLDAELVQRAIAAGQLDVSNRPFLKRVLVDEWDRLGWAFQQFLAGNGLSSHMWMAARKR